MEQDGEYDKKLDALIKGSEQVVSLEEINVKLHSLGLSLRRDDE